jgi:ribosome-binding protein aMBF1 (putative translation factor)
MIFDVNNSNLCPLCLHDGHSIKLELTESMLLVCKRCSRAFYFQIIPYRLTDRVKCKKRININLQ